MNTKRLRDVAIAMNCGGLLATAAIAQQFDYPARGQSRRQNAAQQQQAQSGQQATFAKARTACLEGRGYTVR